MGLGDMDSRNLNGIESPGNTMAGRGYQRRGQKPAAPILMLVAAVLLLVVVTGSAKDKQPTTRIVSGTVYDDAQNVIVGATIELKDTQTGKVQGIYSQETGEYQYSGLRFDHDYTVKAMYKGSSSEVRRISMFDTRWHLVMNLTVPKPTK
jgi:hypothetical protein